MPNPTITRTPQPLIQIGSLPEAQHLPAEPDKFKVVLVQAGVEPKLFEVPPGTTIKELLGKAQVSSEKHTITARTEKVTEERELRPGDIIFLVPVPKNACKG